MIAAAVAGFLTGLSLILPIGAQNAHVLRQGMLRAHTGSVVVVCAASDLVLIAVGAAGVGTAVEHAGWLLEAARWFGVAFLTWYAIGALRRAAGTEHLVAAEEVATSRRRVVGRTLALTWLNPHVYLDTVLLLGSLAATHTDVAGGQWWFAAGAGVASIAWFTTLGFGSRALSPLLARPNSWRVLEVFVAATMLFVAVRLALE
ncbi:LysE/ArgO family amino acid transporter [Rudaeicoccus suwonensis]|uniref:L-lysine exporter family protein LysE/ArgO n=1 Tax=Rudaeicoccus suwonensis TaxID=657409 RepID=A0A561DWX2_9MICO|nr:LysE/ArgO family amino acid transporter [Rudaeicoccus suwonensis]TWE07830.1 L-lysine exporter family protein LysE/ArgO [Rudaeicoccus suwonensis]